MKKSIVVFIGALALSAFSTQGLTQTLEKIKPRFSIRPIEADTLGQPGRLC